MVSVGFVFSIFIHIIYLRLAGFTRNYGSKTEGTVMKRSRSTPGQIATIDSIGAQLGILSVENHGGYHEVLVINTDRKEVEEQIEALVGKITDDDDRSASEESDPCESMMISIISEEFVSPRQFEAAFMRRHGYLPRLKEDD